MARPTRGWWRGSRAAGAEKRGQDIASGSTTRNWPHGGMRSILPMMWAAFSIYFVTILSGVIQVPFYVIDRNVGTVGAADVWTIITPYWDTLVFVVLASAVLFVHSYLSDTSGRTGAVAQVLTFGFVAGLAGYLFSSHLFLWLMGPSFVGILFLDARKVAAGSGNTPRPLIFSTLLWLLLTAFVLSVLSTVAWVAAGLGGAYPVGIGIWDPAMAALGLLGLVYPLVPWILLIFLFSWVLRPVKRLRARFPEWPRDAPKVGPEETSRPSGALWPAILMVMAVAVAIFVRVYAYLPAINPGGLRVGTDAIRGYACWLGLSPQGIPFDECLWSWWSLHIGSLWVLQGINYLTRSPDLTMKVAPAVWGIFFDLATYVLVKEGTGDPLLAGVSALFSAVSLETLVGIDAGILANWLALPVAFLFFAVMLRAFRTRNKLYLLPGLFLFVAMLFIHPWTWFLMAVVFATYLAIELLQRAPSHELGSAKLEGGILLSMVLMAVGAFAASRVLSPDNWLYVGFEAAIESVNLNNVVNVIPNLQTSLIQWVGGGETNPLWWVLGALGVLAIPSVRGRFGKLLLMWVALISIAIPLGGGPSLIQERVLFDLPLPILAAVGAVWLGRYLSESFPRDSLWRWRGYNVPLFLIVASATLLSLGFDLEYIGFLFRI